jgi:hypothetical protein
MSMLDAGTSEFRMAYPYGAKVYDRWGRLLKNVVACDPETGEVLVLLGPMGWPYGLTPKLLTC